MSLNAYTNTTRRQHLIMSATDADYGLDGSMTLKQIADEAVYEERYVRRSSFRRFQCPITDKEYFQGDGVTIDWSHLSDLVHRAVEDSGFTNIPWNIENMVNANVAPGSYPRYASRAGAEKVVKKVQRFCGWLKAAADLYGVRKVVEKTQSSRGMWARRTTLHLWDFAARNPSPGKLERKLWKVKVRAEAILSAFEGQKPSWASIAQALMVTDQAGKAAVIATAISLSGNSHFRSYREAREWLVDYHLCKVADESDGVESRREEEPRLVKLGMEVFRIAIPQMSRRGHQIGVDFQFLVRSTNGRTYHSNWGGPREALHEALHAWKRQDELVAKHADLVGFLNGEHGFCPLVIREDSYRAGNCSAGTESWLRERGWSDRRWIPAMWLIPHLEYSLVRNVAMKLYRCHTEQKSAA